MVFDGYSGFLHCLQLASHELVTIWCKCYEEQNSKFQILWTTSSLPLWHGWWKAIELQSYHVCNVALHNAAHLYTDVDRVCNHFSLFNLLQTFTNSTNQDDIAQSLSNLTAVPDQLTGRDIDLTSSVIENIAEVDEDKPIVSWRIFIYLVFLYVLPYLLLFQIIDSLFVITSFANTRLF